MTDRAYIFMLVLGASLLVGILASVHISANRLAKRIEKRRAEAARGRY